MATSAPFGGGIWASCYEHFVPGESPKVDVTRLAVSCGPSTGLTRFAHTAGTLDEASQPVVFRWEGKRRDCFRVFAAAAAPVADLEVELKEIDTSVGKRAEPAPRVVLSNRNERWVAAPDDGPFCAEHDGRFEARFLTHGGRGEFAAWVYRADGMVPKKPRKPGESANPAPSAGR